MPDHFYVYPAYLDRSTTRALGRRVPQGSAPTSPTLESMAEAAKRLGFTAEIEADKAYTRDPLAPGRLKVTKQKGTSKTAFLRRLADDLRTHAGPKGAG
ncbi:MAG TPA: signal recognition particle subunit SRP19/SEC65 family protein [Thermoplasmata archaeon]|nr:signal recognition particle subunit SRP19/SEC65 family protein [Thermoplasmata archaeon]